MTIIIMIIVFRGCIDGELLSRASKDLQDRFPHLSFFEARWLLIATWHNVTFFGSTDPSLVKDLLNLNVNVNVDL